MRIPVSMGTHAASTSDLGGITRLDKLESVRKLWNKKKIIVP